MCGRFTMLSYEEVASVIEAVEQRLTPAGQIASRDTDSQIVQRPQAFPGSEISLIAPNANGELEAAQSIWGFNPEWSKRTVFNTRIESALNKSPMWREAVENGRCIIPVASFFEPHATETAPSPRTGRPMKRPYEFADPNDKPLLLAGLRNDGRCSIVTCEPNRWVAPVHNRMPLVMRFQEALTWLSPEWPLLADRTAIELLVQPEQLQQPEPSDQLSLF